MRCPRCSGKLEYIEKYAGAFVYQLGEDGSYDKEERHYEGENPCYVVCVQCESDFDFYFNREKKVVLIEPEDLSLKEGFYNLGEIVGEKHRGRYLYAKDMLIHCHSRPKLISGTAKEEVLDLLRRNKDSFVDNDAVGFYANYKIPSTNEGGVVYYQYELIYDEEKDCTTLEQGIYFPPKGVIDQSSNCKQHYSF